jgi:hypothetical protein
MQIGRTVRLGIAVSLAVSGGALLLSITPSSAGPTGGKLASTATAREVARDSGSGRFRAGFLPPGFSLVSETQQDFAEPKIINGEQVADPAQPKKVGTVLEYSNLSREQWRQRWPQSAPPDGAMKSIFVVVVPDTDIRSELASRAKRRLADLQTLSLRGRSGQLFHMGGSTAVKWFEHEGLAIQVTGHGVSESDVLSVAKQLHEET